MDTPDEPIDLDNIALIAFALNDEDRELGNKASAASKKRQSFEYARVVKDAVRRAVRAVRDQQTGEINNAAVARWLNDNEPNVRSMEGKDFAGPTVSRLLYETAEKTRDWIEFQCEYEIERDRKDRLKLFNDSSPTDRKYAARLIKRRDEIIAEGIALEEWMRLADEPIRKPERPLPF